MVRKTTVKFLSVLFFLPLSIGWSAVGSADQPDESNRITLPRSFQGARLGMTRYELSAVVPEAGKISSKAGHQASRAVLVSAGRDSYVRRIEYRFYQGTLQELAIYYKYDRIPRGYEGLLDKLKKSYGRPFVQNVQEYDPRADIFAVKKTVWKDDATAITLSELRRIREGEEVYDVVVTMTDVALQQAYEQREEERRREQELAIPVPLNDHHQKSL
jgi:hypothetical protein